jgi:exodeoxyribonuclease VII large subunit
MVQNPESTGQVWQVGALTRAIAGALDARFNPVAVRGELSGFSAAASGHCYFSIKDEQGQIRCAMFRRAASLLDFSPRDGQLVEIRGRLGLYEARGDLQMVVESMIQAGQGALFEQFARLKAKLEQEGLFDPARKRSLLLQPRGIGVVTSLNAAAWRDVVTALRRRVPHIPVVLVPAAVQGEQAPRELVQALSKLYLLEQHSRAVAANLTDEEKPIIDVILLVRGGGSIEDLWAFNDEQLARTLVQSPVPVISGVGHETDFTIADFCADVRAPTPTAAAELAALPQAQWLSALDAVQKVLKDVTGQRLDQQNQRLDAATARLGRPSGLVARQQLNLSRHSQQLHHGLRMALQTQQSTLLQRQNQLPQALAQRVGLYQERLDRASLRLQLLDPRRVLQRGYALLTDLQGQPITQTGQTHLGQSLKASLAVGEVDLTVTAPRLF